MRQLIKALLVGTLTALILTVSSGCSGRVQEMVDELADIEIPAGSPTSDELPEAIIDPGDSELLTDTAMETNEASVEAIMAETEALPWSDDIPDVFVEFKDGYCIISDHIKSSDGDVWMLTFVDVDMDEAVAYNETLIKNGWSSDNYMDGFMYAFYKDTYETTITIGENEDGTLWYTLYLTYDLDLDYDSDLNHMDVGDLPDGYPIDEMPLYSSSTSILIGATEINTGGSTIYSIEIGCDETPDEVVDVLYPYLDKLDEGKVMKVLMDGNGLLQGGSEEWFYTIIIEAVDYEGKSTSIAYQVTPNPK